MTPRTFLIPSASLVTMCLTSACGSGLTPEGDWTLESTTGNATIEPNSETYTDTDGTYSYTYSYVYAYAMSVLADLTGTLTYTYTYTYTYNDDPPEVDVSTTNYSLVATKLAKKQYGIVVNGLLSMDCTVNSDVSMTCTEGSATLEWVK